MTWKMIRRRTERGSRPAGDLVARLLVKGEFEAPAFAINMEAGELDRAAEPNQVADELTGR